MTTPNQRRTSAAGRGVEPCRAAAARGPDSSPELAVFAEADRPRTAAAAEAESSRASAVMAEVGSSHVPVVVAEVGSAHVPDVGSAHVPEVGSAHVPVVVAEAGSTLAPVVVAEVGSTDAPVVVAEAGSTRGPAVGERGLLRASAAMAGERTPRGGLRTSEVAAAAGVNRQTLRYYERRGLLAEPERSPGGHRIYPAEAVTLLRAIKGAQRLGFTLDEVAGLLAAGPHRRGRADPALPDRARSKLAEVEARIADLQVVASTLRAAVAAGCDDLVDCAGQPTCPIPFAGAGVDT